MKNILLAMKPGTDSARLVDTARSVAPDDASFTLVSYVMVGGEQPEHEALSRARASIDATIEQLAEEGFSAKGVCEIATIAAGRHVIDFAERMEADLIVIGLTKRSRVGKALLGSDTQTVILTADCPVLTVRIG